MFMLKFEVWIINVFFSQVRLSPGKLSMKCAALGSLFCINRIA